MRDKVEGFPDTRADWTSRSLDDVPMTKGSGAKTVRYAEGGPVIKEGRSIFMKQPDPFRTDSGAQNYAKTGKDDPMANPIGRDGKVEKAIKPRT